MYPGDQTTQQETRQCQYQVECLLLNGLYQNMFDDWQENIKKKSGWSGLYIYILCIPLYGGFLSHRGTPNHPVVMDDHGVFETIFQGPHICSNGRWTLRGFRGCLRPSHRIPIPSEELVNGCFFSQLPSGKHTKSYWKWWFLVGLPIKNGDFP